MLDLEAAAGRLPQPFTPAAARAVGLSRDVLARGVRRGLLVRLAHSSYVLARVWDDAGRRGQHLLLVAAASSQRPGSCVTHHSAALVHGLPMPIDCPRFVSLTTDRTHRTSTARAPDRLRNAALPLEHITTRDQLVVTTPGRTVMDCLRELSLPDAVAVADAAVREGLTTVSELRMLRRQQRHWPGIRAADDGITLIDPRRETWLESWSFTRLWQLGVPTPESQVIVYDARGWFLARVDGLWREHGTVAEADGAGKYLGQLNPDGPSGEAAARLVLAEKVREDRLRSTGLEVVRWSFGDVRHNAPAVVDQIEAAWERGDLGRFRGHLVASRPPSPRGATRFVAPSGAGRGDGTCSRGGGRPRLNFVPTGRRIGARSTRKRRVSGTKWGYRAAGAARGGPGPAYPRWRRRRSTQLTLCPCVG